MKYKWFYFLLSLIVIFFLSAIEVGAMNTGFSTEELSEDAKATFLTNTSVSLLKEKPEKSGILCFDVNEYGMIAVGQNNSQHKEVCIYNSHGDFLYGYTFNCNQEFAVEWDKQTLNIYFVRSDVIISVDLDGNITELKSVQDTMDNNSYRNLLHSTERTVGNTTYLVKNDMGILNWFATSFSQIVIIDSNGTESVIYDVNSIQTIKMVVIIILISIIVFSAIIVIVWQFIKFKDATNV